MMEKWIQEGTIYKFENLEGKDRYWSGANPAFQALCYRMVFDSNSGVDS